MKPVPPPTDDELTELGRASRRTMEAAPPAALERAFAIWRPRTAAPGLLQRLVAKLRFDDWSATAAPALRSARPRVRQLIFSIDDIDVDLRIEPGPASKPGTWVLRGQVLGMPATSSAVLRSGEQASQELLASCDEFGGFHFENVHAGPQQLSIRAADLSVELPAFDVGTER